MREIEARAEFDEAEFAARLRAVGGVWIELPKTEYATVDGSHLTRAAGAELSRFVAGLLAADGAGR